jgi:exopolyphosphatase/guanosine-5'-triphosphate,3'-diphosphate pyrophosphatase
VTQSTDSSRVTASIAQALRVGDLAAALYRRAVASPDVTLAKLVEWAGRLHEVGMSISHDGFHKHGAYILQNADMPGFAAGEQGRSHCFVFGCRGGSRRSRAASSRRTSAAVLAVRIAVWSISAHGACRAENNAQGARGIQFGIAALARRASVDRLSGREEKVQWAALGHPWRVASANRP